MSEIEKRRTAGEIVDAYQKARGRILQALHEVVEASDEFAQTGVSPDLDLGHRGSARFTTGMVEDALKPMEAAAWDRILITFEVWSMLSIARQRELQDLLDKGGLGPLTRANVGAMLDGWSRQIPDMLRETVQEVLTFLDGRGWKNKRAKGLARDHMFVPRRLILSGAIEARCKYGWYRRVNHYFTARLHALERVCRAIKGRTGEVEEWDTLRSKINNSDLPASGETEFFEYKCFENGNLHLVWKDEGLLRRLNELAAGLAMED